MDIPVYSPTCKLLYRVPVETAATMQNVRVVRTRLGRIVRVYLKPVARDLDVGRETRMDGNRGEAVR